ncbi:MAG: hypothetical protein IIC67_03080, partial [Thaumarchaeota archaeon]|nr:hypothetical protein [Nitrososphaerota archaeon]
KDKSQWKYELVIPKKIIEKAEFDEGNELKAEVKKGEIKIKRLRNP